ncbi:hypothetical protein J43TS3_31880 [Ornithinibacillus bavariensis]|uniref:Uncharacterized protein n=1 Tax=Ornithinibacillus bavariensis TaxID=545502 RepID=A0A919X9N4_9BACI|nr:hypothetical protein J43TS3_31880 [Ornithinibacillus bavariensis]
MSNGIEYETSENTKSQLLSFGISWIRPYTEDNESQTCDATDVSVIRFRQRS